MPQGFGALQRMRQAAAPQPDRDQNSFARPQALRRRQAPMPNTGAGMGGIGNRPGLPGQRPPVTVDPVAPSLPPRPNDMGAIRPGFNNLAPQDPNRYVTYGTPVGPGVPEMPPVDANPIDDPYVPPTAPPRTDTPLPEERAPITTGPAQGTPTPAPTNDPSADNLAVTHPAYEAGMRALEDELAAELAAAGVDEQNIKAMLELTKARIGVNRAEGLRRTDESANERGIFNSGIRTRDRGYVDYDHDSQLQNSILDSEGQLASVFGRRSAAQANYNRGLAELQLEIAKLLASDPSTPTPSSDGDDTSSSGSSGNRGGWNGKRGGPQGDRDRDGILNKNDKDRDGDGIRNRKDRRPNRKRRNRR